MHDNLLAYIVRVGFAQKNDAINKPTNAKQTCGQEVKNTHTGFALIEFMCAQETKEEAQQKRDPLISRSKGIHACIDIGVGIRVGVGVVNDDARLLMLLHIFYLTSAVRTNNCCDGDLCTAMLTEFGILLNDGVVINSIIIHVYLPLYV